MNVIDTPDFYTPLANQITTYNNFDILVTQAGSHLTNLLFTNRTRVGILELGLSIRDFFWRENAVRLGINHYYYSNFNHSCQMKRGQSKSYSYFTYCHNSKHTN